MKFMMTARCSGYWVGHWGEIKVYGPNWEDLQ